MPIRRNSRYDPRSFEPSEPIKRRSGVYAPPTPRTEAATEAPTNPIPPGYDKATQDAWAEANPGVPHPVTGEIYVPGGSGGSGGTGGGTNLDAINARQAPMVTATQVGEPAKTDVARADFARVNDAQAAEIRKAQMEFLAQLKARASGAVPSAAELQMKRGIEDAIAAQASAAASQRGGSAGLAAKNAATNMASVQQRGISDTSSLRANEQAQAEQALNTAYDQIRAQDIGLAQYQAGLEQQANLANANWEQQANESDAEYRQRTAELNANLGQQVILANQQAGLSMTQMNDALVNAYLNRGMSMAEAQLAATTALQQEQIKAETQAALAGKTLDWEKTKTGFQIAGNVVGAGLAAASNAWGGSGEDSGPIDYTQYNTPVTDYTDLNSDGTTQYDESAALSDKNAKKHIGLDNNSIRKLLDSIQPVSYEYKQPEKYGAGRRIGIIAQDLEKTQAGKQIVEDTPEGKKIMVAPSIGALFASVADLHDRLAALEKNGKQK